MKESSHPLRHWRKKRKIAGKALAMDLGVSQQLLSMIENRQCYPSLRLLARVTKRTGLSWKAFLPVDP
jgi:transcriptional regulator with XRE-family HTH domain